MRVPQDEAGQMQRSEGYARSRAGVRYAAAAPSAAGHQLGNATRLPPR